MTVNATQTGALARRGPERCARGRRRGCRPLFVHNDLGKRRCKGLINIFFLACSILGARRRGATPDMPAVVVDGKREHHLTPRTVSGQIVLGELCLGKRHFDCIGFVNYCFWSVISPTWDRSFLQYLKDFEGAFVRFRKAIESKKGNGKRKRLKRADIDKYLNGFRDSDNAIKASDLQPGDVVIRVKGDKIGKSKRAIIDHSGICYRDPKGRIRVLNCSSGATGVVSSPYKATRWPHRLRIKSYWSN